LTYTPKTNGEAERFIQTALREWAYAWSYTHSNRRNERLPIWLHHYNWHRPHGGIQAKPGEFGRAQYSATAPSENGGD
jgi:transposase InsO family protein